MPRGRESSAEQSRVKAKEIAPGRDTTRGTGAIHFEKTGYGNDSMQKNPNRVRKS